jgi:maleate isomerase
MAACDAMKVKRLGFVTPYVEQVSAAMRSLLEDNGCKIAGFGSFEESDDRVVARISPKSLLQAITAVDAMAECDAVFVSCTNLRVVGIVEEAERRIGKPVISSNIALAWHMKKLAGLPPVKKGCGALLRLQV